LAFKLYWWNIVLSESLLMPFHVLEVALRNRLSDLLYARTNVAWPLIALGERSWVNFVRVNQVLQGLLRNLVLYKPRQQAYE
jgi:hypothetical protein